MSESVHFSCAEQLRTLNDEHQSVSRLPQHRGEIDLSRVECNGKRTHSFVIAGFVCSQETESQFADVLFIKIEGTMLMSLVRPSSKFFGKDRRGQIFRNKRSFSSNSHEERWIKGSLSKIGIFIGGTTAAMFWERNSPNIGAHSDVHRIDTNLMPSSDHKTKSSSILATSAFSNNSQRPPFRLSVEEDPSDEYDFVVLGHGNVGKAAVKELSEKCPNARILVVDPHPILGRQQMSISQPSSPFGNKAKQGISSLTGSAMGIDHAKQRIDVLTSNTTNKTDELTNRSSPGIKRIGYKHSMLICSGVRGAPPPSSLVDERATERILELRSTQLPTMNEYLQNQSSSEKKYVYPILPTQSVRQITTMAASQGAKICILGSDLEAVELAVAAVFSRKGEADGSSICMLFGGAAPLGGMLPRYLSTAVSKRLRHHGIDVRER